MLPPSEILMEAYVRSSPHPVALREFAFEEEIELEFRIFMCAHSILADHWQFHKVYCIRLKDIIDLDLFSKLLFSCFFLRMLVLL